MTVSIFEATQIPQPSKFRLDSDFIDKMKEQEPEFGFNGLGRITYLRTYSRLKDNGTKEEWWETIRRVVEGTYNIQKRHIKQNGLTWDEEKAQRSAQKMYQYIFEMKFLPPGRGLWAMGTDIIEEKGLFSALNNCAFVSTENMDGDPISPFTFMMDASMVGVGVGFDVKGAGKVKVLHPKTEFLRTFVVPDTREGWVEALSELLESYFYKDRYKVVFDYSEIRPAGTPLKTFGGKASGYEPLETLLEDVRELLERRAGGGKYQWEDSYLTERDITDIMNMIGVCVVAGNVRRTAQIAFGDSEEFINLKNYEKNPDRQAYGWASNNSYLAEVGDDYSDPAERTQYNGEPGYFWLENAQMYGRMGSNTGEKYNVDYRATGGNPCLEQTLESYEMCCLVETFPDKCEDFEEFRDVLKYAYLYAKTVTLGRTHWNRTNEVMLRNRRIGTSVSGVAQFIEHRGLEELRNWLDEGYKTIEMYDKRYSEWFKVPKSIKITSVKPSGTVSLLAGATPGVHYPESRYYLRRITISKGDPLVEYCKNLGIEIEPHLMSDGEGGWYPSDKSVQAVFPVDSGVDNVRPSMWKQMELTAFMQEWWADNQVSSTVSFELWSHEEYEFAKENPELYKEEYLSQNKLKFPPHKESTELEEALDMYQFRLKGVSFLPRKDLSFIYPQLPYEPIDEDEYYHRKMLQDFNGNKDAMETVLELNDATPEKYCTTDTCVIPDEFK